MTSGRTEPDDRTIGFIGLGNMGYAMCRNLLRRNYRVRGYDNNPAMVQRIASLPSFTGCASVAEAAEGADVLILMLPNGKIVRSALLDQDADNRSALASLPEGATIIDMSSSAPVGTRELGSEIAAHGLKMIDAPVSGGVARAETGKLAIIVGGDAAALESCRPILDSMGSSIIHVGELGSGHAMKALNNYVSATGLVAACEAIRVAQAFGIDAQKAVDVLNASTGRNNSTENKLAQFVLSRSFASGFSASLMQKDLATALDLANDLRTQTVLAKDVVEFWTKAAETLPAGADHTEIMRMLE